MIDFQYPLDGAASFMLQNFKTINQSQFRSKLSFLNIFFPKPGLTKTSYLRVAFNSHRGRCWCYAKKLQTRLLVEKDKIIPINTSKMKATH